MIYKNQEIGDCIVAPNKPHKSGYHRVSYEGKRYMAHQFAYFMTYGAPPLETPWVLHKCNNKACWNPGHLYAGTPSDNVKDAIQVGVIKLPNPNGVKTHCPQGHEFTPENTYAHMYKKYGWNARHCRACRSQQKAMRKTT